MIELRRGLLASLLLILGLVLNATVPRAGHAQFTETPVRERAQASALSRPTVAGHVVSSGDGFQILESNVPVVADNGRARAASALADGVEDAPMPGFHRTFALTNLAGVSQVALPEQLKAELVAEYSQAGVDPAQVKFNTLLIDEAAAAAAYAPEAVEVPDSATAGPPNAPGRARALGLFGICSKKHSEKSKGVSYVLSPTRTSLPLSVSGFAGTYDSRWNSTGRVSMSVHYIQKSRCGITYGVEFDRVVAEGELDVNGSELTYGGTVFQIPERTIAQVTLLDIEESYSFWVGPFMIVVSAGLEVRAGLNVSAQVDAQVGLRTPLTGRYSFIYECRESGCSSPRPPEHTLSALIADSQFVGAIDAQAKLEPWIDITADVEGGFYSKALRFAKVEALGHVGVPASLWGYYGNLCGDADGDGRNETVSAATLDVNADLYTFVSATLLNKTWERAVNLGLGAPWELLPETEARGPRAKYTYRRNVLFRDFISGGSSALSPLVIASPVVSANEYQRASYTLRARPCARTLGSKLDYVVDWGTDGPQTIQAPASGITVAHTWGQPGSQMLSAYIDRDSLGRDLISPATTRTIVVEPKSDVNRAPVVDLGADRTVTPGTTLSLASTASDPDGTSLVYAWTQVSGPAVSLVGIATSTVSFSTPTTDSQVVLALTVTDGGGLGATDQVIVNVRAPVVRPRPIDECGIRKWPQRCIPR